MQLISLKRRYGSLPGSKSESLWRHEWTGIWGEGIGVSRTKTKLIDFQKSIDVWNQKQWGHLDQGRI